MIIEEDEDYPYWYLVKTESCGCKWYDGIKGELQQRLCCSHQFGHPFGKHYHPIKGNPFSRIEVDLTSSP